MTLSPRKFSLDLRVKRLSWRRILRAIVPYGISLGCLAALQGSGLGEAANLLIYDTAVSIRPAPSGAKTPIRIIGLTESDIQRFGWPLNDGLMAKAVDRLLAQGVLGIGIDFYRDRGVEPGVQELRSLIQRHPRIITIFNAGESISSPPGTPLRQQSFNDLVVDTDGVIRRDLVHVEGQPTQTMALPCAYLSLRKAVMTCVTNLISHPWMVFGCMAIRVVIVSKMLLVCSACCLFISLIVFQVGVLRACWMGRYRPANSRVRLC